jgi:N-acetylmuramoyl-L-alanine amidase
MIALTPKADRDIRYIVLHHSATPNTSETVDAQEIHRWHKERGFLGIGYNYVVLKDGTVEAGRPEYWVGAHAKGNNTISLGVCIVGTGEPEGAQDASTRELVNALLARYPTAKVRGHGELPGNDTECPGFDVDTWLAKG